MTKKQLQVCTQCWHYGYCAYTRPHDDDGLFEPPNSEPGRKETGEPTCFLAIDWHTNKKNKKS